METGGLFREPDHNPRRASRAMRSRSFSEWRESAAGDHAGRVRKGPSGSRFLRAAFGAGARKKCGDGRFASGHPGRKLRGRGIARCAEDFLEAEFRECSITRQKATAYSGGAGGGREPGEGCAGIVRLEGLEGSCNTRARAGKFSRRGGDCSPPHPTSKRSSEARGLARSGAGEPQAPAMFTNEFSKGLQPREIRRVRELRKRGNSI